ncbi:MAG TPA: DUF6179 domain-containing protein [Caproiciproducens sp.]|nr:DUF6179 domain-containing protein [Caproiciproducens sp.]
MINESLAGFLSPEETASLQARLMGILSEEILYYTHGQSNSVSVETAQSLLESMLYCITAYLNTLPDPHAALRTQEIHEIYLEGLALISRYVEKAKKLYAVAKATRVQTDLIAYNNTMDFAIDKILQCYDPRFGAQNTTPLSTSPMLDYPLSKDDMSVTGILYIINYLNQLILENKFCAKYSKNHIRALLFAHGAKHHLDYRDMLINIPEVILEYEKKHKKTGGSKNPPVEIPYFEPDQ